MSQIVVEIDFSSGTRYYSHRGVRGTSTAKNYKPMLTQAGELTRGIPAIPGTYQASDISIIIRNREKEFSELKDSVVFYGVPIRVKQALAGGTFTTIAAGRITDWSIQGREVLIRATDDVMERLAQTVTTTNLRLLTRDVFPNMPSNTVERLVPLPYGKLELSAAAISEGTGPATVPCYLIDPAVGQSKYRYVCAQVAIDSVRRVFAYETLQSGGYAVTEAVYDGKTMTVIDFDSDPRVASRAREVEISCDLWGVKDSVGNVEENPADQMTDFLTNYGPSVTVDFSTASADCDTEGYVGGFVLIDKSWTFQNVIDLVSQSFLMPIYPSRSGTITASVITDEFVTPTKTMTEDREILAGSFQIESNTELATRVRYQSQFNWLRGFFHTRKSLFITGEEELIGREILRDLELPCVRDTDVAANVVRAHAPIFRESAMYVRAELDPLQFANVELNSSVGFTHQEGIGTGGWSNQAARIIQSDFDPGLNNQRVSIVALVIKTTVTTYGNYQTSGGWMITRAERLVTVEETTTAVDDYAKNAYVWSMRGGPEFSGQLSSVR